MPRAQPARDLYDDLRRASVRLDELLRDVGLGTRSQRAHDAIVARGEAIADEIRAALRGPAVTSPVHPPLGRTTDGYVW